MNGIFSDEEMMLVKQLAYENGENNNSEIGFEYNGQWITNPFIDETGRFEFKNVMEMCVHFGESEVNALLSELLRQKNK